MGRSRPGQWLFGKTRLHFNLVNSAEAVSAIICPVAIIKGHLSMTVSMQVSQ